MDSGWDGMQIAELAISVMTPLALFGLGILVAKSARRVEYLQHANQTVMARRVELFGQVAPRLNRMLCFAAFIGRWKEITPTDVLMMKRDVDEVMYANRLLFSVDLFDAYRAFMNGLFAMYATVDGDAPILARIDSPLGDRRSLSWWTPQMGAMFASDQRCQPEDALRLYDDLSAAFRIDLYVTDLAQRLDDVHGDRAADNRRRSRSRW